MTKQARLDLLNEMMTYASHKDNYTKPDRLFIGILDILIDMNKPSKSSFTPPTLSQVNGYCLITKNPLIGSEFCDFYESKGWMVGKNKMKSWQAAVRDWCS